MESTNPTMVHASGKRVVSLMSSEEVLALASQVQVRVASPEIL